MMIIIVVAELIANWQSTEGISRLYRLMPAWQPGTSQGRDSLSNDLYEAV